MVLAIDYDQTFSDYPEQFTKVREMFQAIGAEVYLVTARDEETERIDPKHDAILSGFDKIIYTSGKAKAGFVRADIFIDDSPVIRKVADNFLKKESLRLCEGIGC